MIDPNETGGYESRLAESLERSLKQAETIAEEITTALIETDTAKHRDSVMARMWDLRKRAEKAEAEVARLGVGVEYAATVFGDYVMRHKHKGDTVKAEANQYHVDKLTLLLAGEAPFSEWANNTRHAIEERDALKAEVARLREVLRASKGFGLLAEPLTPPAEQVEGPVEPWAVKLRERVVELETALRSIWWSVEEGTPIEGTVNRALGPAAVSKLRGDDPPATPPPSPAGPQPADESGHLSYYTRPNSGDAVDVIAKTGSNPPIWTRSERTSPSGKALFRCSECGFETPTPDKVCPGCTLPPLTGPQKDPLAPLRFMRDEIMAVTGEDPFASSAGPSAPSGSASPAESSATESRSAEETKASSGREPCPCCGDLVEVRADMTGISSKIYVCGGCSPSPNAVVYVNGVGDVFGLTCEPKPAPARRWAVRIGRRPVFASDVFPERAGTVDRRASWTTDDRKAAEGVCRAWPAGTVVEVDEDGCEVKP